MYMLPPHACIPLTVTPGSLLTQQSNKDEMIGGPCSGYPWCVAHAGGAGMGEDVHQENAKSYIVARLDTYAM
jgi:hypothetical protein